jgi:hypothetical protein
MKIVIQCAARKLPGAGSLAAADGRPILFVAHPVLAPADPRHVHVRPDDRAEDGETWRARLVTYNDGPDNPLNLLPAYQLYAHDVYRALVQRFGVDNVFILSAGWGVIPASFLTPAYDITFKAAKTRPWKRRRPNERYEDFVMLPDDGGAIVFLGGKDYLRLFCRLTAAHGGAKTVLYNSGECPDVPTDFQAMRFETRTRTNWHYEAAAALVAGALTV